MNQDVFVNEIGLQKNVNRQNESYWDRLSYQNIMISSLKYFYLFSVSDHSKSMKKLQMLVIKQMGLNRGH